MRILFYTDPHLGLRRQANTTRASSQALQDRLKAITLMTINAVNADKVVCLGDLFDSYSNSEEVIKESLQIVSETDVILAGNHDVENREGVTGSLELLSKMGLSTTFLFSYPGETGSIYLDVGKTRLVFVPHVISQELFEAALEDAVQCAEPGHWLVLCLHCNYNLPAEHLSNTTLNLTEERADQLLSRFHYVLLGHVHEPKDLKAGRLKIIGNVHPTGFSDISDKRVLLYDTETGEFEEEMVWSSEKFWKGKVSELDSRHNPVPFLDLEDDLERGEAAKVVKQLFASGALAVRLRRPETAQREVENQAGAALERLPDLIREDLQKNKPHLLSLWEEVSSEI